MDKKWMEAVRKEGKYAKVGVVFSRSKDDLQAREFGQRSPFTSFIASELPKPGVANSLPHLTSFPSPPFFFLTSHSVNFHDC